MNNPPICKASFVRWEWNRPISYLYASETQERRLKGVKIQKSFKGKHALGPPRTLRLWRWFRKSVSIYPRSAPVGNSIVEVSVSLCNDWEYSTLSLSRILVKMRCWGRPLSEIWHASTSIWVSRSNFSVHYLDRKGSPIRRPQPDLNSDMFVPNLFFFW